MTDQPDAPRKGFWFGFVVAIARPLLMLLTKRDWRGQQHLPRTGGVVVVTNHISHFDPLAVGHYLVDNGRVPRFLGKASLFSVPVLGRIITGAGQIPVYRATIDAADALRAAVAAVERGECVVVYPEGTITRDPALWPMTGKTGAARIALQTRCPVIPVAQWGPQEVYAAYGHKVRPLPRKTMHIAAGPPVDLGAFAGQPVTAELLHKATTVIMAAITAEVATLRGESPPAEVYDPRTAGRPDTGGQGQDGAR